MVEFKVGERVTLEVTETDKESCKGCFFDSKKFWKNSPSQTGYLLRMGCLLTMKAFW